MLDLNGKTALITGGAGGLGRALARAFEQEGAKVVLWDLVTGQDVADPAAVRDAAKALGPVDILVNNAGVHAPGDFLDASEADIRRQVDVNLNSYFWCAKAFVPAMAEKNSGHVVMIASAAGLLGVPGMAAYSATKHAVVGFAESLRLELRRSGRTGVGMTIVCPSFIDTGMFPNTTAPMFTPWLKPERLAEKIVAAVKADRLYVRAPAMVNLIPILKTLPQAAVDALCAFTGMDRSLAGPAAGR